MLIHIDINGFVGAIGARIDTSIGVLFTRGTAAHEINSSDVLTLCACGNGIFKDSYGRYFFETDSAYVGYGAGSTSISTRGDTVTRVGNTEFSYMGNKVTGIGGTSLHWMGEKVTEIGMARLSYRGDKLAEAGGIQLSYRGDKVARIGALDISYIGDRVNKIGNQPY